MQQSFTINDHMGFQKNYFIQLLFFIIGAFFLYFHVYILQLPLFFPLW